MHAHIQLWNSPVNIFYVRECWRVNAKRPKLCDSFPSSFSLLFLYDRPNDLEVYGRSKKKRERRSRLRSQTGIFIPNFKFLVPLNSLMSWGWCQSSVSASAQRNARPRQPPHHKIKYKNKVLTGGWLAVAFLCLFFHFPVSAHGQRPP